jgi:dolichol-phosphate mannosyltransferase
MFLLNRFAIKISVILPTYNERKNLQEVFEGVTKNLKARDLEIIVVDDNSPDGTADKAEELSGRYPVRVLRRTGKFGLASAVMHGFMNAEGEVLVCMDADGQHDPEALPHMLNALRRFDIVVGTRVDGSIDEDWGLKRKFVSWGATMVARPLTRVSDPMSGFFMLKKDILSNVKKWNLIGYKILLEILVKTRIKNVGEVPIMFHKRQHGETKLGLSEVIRYFYLIFRLTIWKFLRI